MIISLKLVDIPLGPVVNYFYFVLTNIFSRYCHVFARYYFLLANIISFSRARYFIVFARYYFLLANIISFSLDIISMHIV